MNPSTKIAAVILLIGAEIIGFFLINRNFFLAEKQKVESPISISQPESRSSSFYGLKTERPRTEEKIVPKNESSLDYSNKEISPTEIFQKTESKLKDFVDKFQITAESQKDISKETVEYFKNFATALQKVSFTSEEISAFKKDKKDQNNRILLLEELLEQAEQNTDLNELKNSFAAWHRFDDKVLEELNKIIPSLEIAAFHQTIIDWFGYHSSVAKKFSKEELSQFQISELVQNFKEKAGIHNQKLKQNQVNLQQSLKQKKTLFGLLNFLKPTVQAVTCGAVIPPPFYNFGGRTTVPVYCCYGLVITIIPPCGGLLYFHYATIAANPYLFRNLVTPGIVILGKSIFTPPFFDCLIGTGYCGEPVCAPIPWETFVLYFGTSLTP